MREMKKKIKQTHMKQPSLCDIENHEGLNEKHLRVTNVGTTLARKSMEISQNQRASDIQPAAVNNRVPLLFNNIYLPCAIKYISTLESTKTRSLVATQLPP